MKKLIILIALLWASFASSQVYHGYVRLGKLSQAQIDAIDVSDTSVIYTAYNTDNAREEINLGAGWVARLSGGSDNLGNHTATQDIDMGGFQILNIGGFAAEGPITSVGTGLYDIGTNTNKFNDIYGGTFISGDGAFTFQGAFGSRQLTTDAAGDLFWNGVAVDVGGVGGGGSYTDEEAQDAVGTILTDTGEIDFTYSDITPSITAALVAASIDESKLDLSVNASLDLADTALQPGGALGTPSSGTATNLTGYVFSNLVSIPAGLLDGDDVGITQVADDPTPVLAGNLDAQAFDILNTELVEIENSITTNTMEFRFFGGAGTQAGLVPIGGTNPALLYDWSTASWNYPILDTADYFTVNNVETALAELGADVAGFADTHLGNSNLTQSGLTRTYTLFDGGELQIKDNLGGDVARFAQGVFSADVINPITSGAILDLGSFGINVLMTSASVLPAAEAGAFVYDEEDGLYKISDGVNWYGYDPSNLGGGIVEHPDTGLSGLRIGAGTEAEKALATLGASDIWISTNAPPAKTGTGTALEMLGYYQYNFGAASSAATFTMINIRPGGYVENLINKAGAAPVVTGATQIPGTKAFVASTNMILHVKDFDGTPKYWFTEFLMWWVLLIGFSRRNFYKEAA